MLTKEIVETILSIDPYNRVRFSEIGISDNGFRSAPRSPGAVTESLLSYASIFKGKATMLFRADNGTLLTHYIIALYDRDKDPVKYTSRLKLPVLVVKGRYCELIELNAPSIGVTVLDNMRGETESAWIREGTIQTISVLPPSRSSEPDVFSKARTGKISVNINFNRPFDLSKAQTTIANWKTLASKLVQSNFSD